MSPGDDRGNIDTPLDEILVLSLAVLTVCPLLATQAEPAQSGASDDPVATVAARTSSAARTSEADLRAALDELPEQTALAIVLPDPARTALIAASLAKSVESAWPGLDPDALLARLGPAALLDEATSAGVDTGARLTFVVGLAGAPHVVRLSLRDPRRFAAWAAAHGAGQPVAKWGEDAVFSLSDTGVACLVRDAGAWCQLAPAAGPDPLAELRRVADTPARRLAQSPSMIAAVARLRPDAEAYVLARPSAVGEAVAAMLLDRAHRAQPFATPAEKRALEADARTRTRRVLAALSAVQSAAAALVTSDARIEIAAELALSDRGAYLARNVTATIDPRDPILGWAETPSLGRVVARVEPQLASELLELVHVHVPAPRLTGTLAVMLLGLDTQCPSAKASGSHDLQAWPLVFPLAGAIGLAGDAPLDRSRLLSGLDIAADPPRDDGVLFRGRLYDSPVEARLAPGTILVGTGHGAGSAAARRWSSARPPEPMVGRPFVDARVNLAAVGAALSTGAYDGETRPELRRLERVYRMLQPMITRYPVARATSQVSGDGARVTVQVSVGQ